VNITPSILLVNIDVALW